MIEFHSVGQMTMYQKANLLADSVEQIQVFAAKSPNSLAFASGIGKQFYEATRWYTPSDWNLILSECPGAVLKAARIASHPLLFQRKQGERRRDFHARQDGALLYLRASKHEDVLQHATAMHLARRFGPQRAEDLVEQTKVEIENKQGMLLAQGDETRNHARGFHAVGHAATFASAIYTLVAIAPAVNSVSSKVLDFLPNWGPGWTAFLLGCAVVASAFTGVAHWAGAELKKTARALHLAHQVITSY